MDCSTRSSLPGISFCSAAQSAGGKNMSVEIGMTVVGPEVALAAVDQALLDLYLTGKISYDTAVAHAKHPDQIRKRAVPQAV